MPRFLSLLLATAVTFALTGCETTGVSDEAAQLSIRAARSPRMGESTASAVPRTYTLRYVNAQTQTLLTPQLPALLDALARQGFQPARHDAEPDAIVWIAAIANFRQEVEVGSMQGPPVADNPDSVRYKNTAAMFGRYGKLMQDDRYGAGEMMIAPSGDIIMTGNLGDNVADEATFTSPVPTRRVLRQRNVLAIWATETAPPQSPADDGELWRVEVMTDLPAAAPAPAFTTLVDTALQNLAQDTHGLQTRPLN